MFCIIYPILLLILCGLSDEPCKYWNDSFAISIGLSVLFFSCCNCDIHIIVQGMKYSKYGYLNKEGIYLPQDMKATIISTKEKYKKMITIATVLYVLSIISLIILVCLDVNDFYSFLGASIMLGVYFIAVLVYTSFGGCHLSISKLLQEVDYSVEKKKEIIVGLPVCIGDL